MKRLILLLLLLLLVSGGNALGCVGKVLYIGISDAPQEQLLGEMVSLLVSERTGTTAKIVTFKSPAEMYNAVKQGKVGLIIENTGHALQMLNRPKADAETAYELAKKEYRTTFNMVWLQPLGSTSVGGTTRAFAPVISVDVLGNLPALPKLVNKLTGVMNDGNYQRYLKALKTDNPKKIARDFLKARKLI